MNRMKSIFNDGQNVILEVDGSYNLKARYTLGLNYIRRADSKNNKYYYLYDAHGDVTVLTDASGNIVKSYDYDIYGKEKESEYLNYIENPIRYTGQYFDEESGLYYLRARYYSPETMRFISEDTYKGNIENPLTLNLYTYCSGNPVMLYDPSGNSGLVILGTVALIGGISSAVGNLAMHVYEKGFDFSSLDISGLIIDTATGAIGRVITIVSGGSPIIGFASDFLLTAGGDTLKAGINGEEIDVFEISKNSFDSARASLVTGFILDIGEIPSISPKSLSEYIPGWEPTNMIQLDSKGAYTIKVGGAKHTKGDYVMKASNVAAGQMIRSIVANDTKNEENKKGGSSGRNTVMQQ